MAELQRGVCNQIIRNLQVAKCKLAIKYLCIKILQAESFGALKLRAQTGYGLNLHHPQVRPLQWRAGRLPVTPCYKQS